MDPDTIAPSSALATALIPTGLAGESERGEVERSAQQAPRQNAAELLASLMDFPGSVALAELLQQEASPPRPMLRAGDEGGLGERLLLDVQARLDSLESLVLKPLTGRRAPSAPPAHELLSSLHRAGLTAGGRPQSEQATLRLAAELGAPFRSALGLSLRQAQAHVATLRWEITHDLRALSARADQLERLDAALSRSMQAKLGELLDRMEHAAHLTFVRACAHALDALPETLDEAALAGWCDADGWLVRYRERCVRMAKALFGHLRRSLEGLTRAATADDAYPHDDFDADCNDLRVDARGSARERRTESP